MANLAVAIKEEISRLARKEIKKLTGSTAQAVARYRREIAQLKRAVHSQDKEIAFLRAQERKRIGQPEVGSDVKEGSRYSSRSVKAQRQRLDLSAADYARLVGVSQLTIYNWEQGKSRPRKEQLAALIALRGIGKREATAKLKLLKSGEARAAAKKTTGRRKTKSS